ncbi:DUF6090 family protein [Maribacter antarcticus]|uniref:DUF6090 family protein n=1 Tax=Maribacter antarcticus TaxID=505250 RepID=UPI0012EB9D8B|nr:DUF6090 family protein [Maribacter antarcticus]
MEKNKTGKYLKYAFGEIVLVVIGILIALQINNWNEKKKIKTKEIKYLTELRKDLVQNLSDINGNISNLQTSKNSNEIIMHHIENNIVYNDSLDYHFSMIYPFITFTINQTTYETLKQGGMELISNDSLRSSISNIYSNRFTSYQTFENTYFVNHYINHIKPMLISEFVSFEFSSSAHPKNYNQFIKNSEYKQTLNFTIDICRNFIRMQSNLKTEVQNLIDSVNNEIGD